MSTHYLIPAGTLVHPIYVLGGWDNGNGREYRTEPAHESVCETIIDWYFTEDDIISVHPPLPEDGYFVNVLLHNDIANMMRPLPERNKDGDYSRYANAFTVEWNAVVAIPATENR